MKWKGGNTFIIENLWMLWEGILRILKCLWKKKRVLKNIFRIKLKNKQHSNQSEGANKSNPREIYYKNYGEVLKVKSVK